MSNAVKSVIYNTSASAQFLGFIPPHGITIAATTGYTLNGNFWDMISLDKQLIDSAVAAVVSGLIEVSVMYNDWVNTVAKIDDYTVVNSKDNYKVFTTLGGDYTYDDDSNPATPEVVHNTQINFTLPATIKGGQRWRFINEIDLPMVITAPSGKLVADGGLTYTTATYSTTSHQIGSCCEVFVNSSATKYMLINIGKTVPVLA